MKLAKLKSKKQSSFLKVKKAYSILKTELMIVQVALTIARPAEAAVSGSIQSRLSVEVFWDHVFQKHLEANVVELQKDVKNAWRSVRVKKGKNFKNQFRWNNQWSHSTIFYSLVCTFFINEIPKPSIFCATSNLI